MARPRTCRRNPPARARRLSRGERRNRERAEALAKDIGERGFAAPGDVAADGVPDEIARRTLERFGRIDILVNIAALPLSTRLPDLSAEEWRRAIEVDLTAPFLMTSRSSGNARAALRPDR